MVTTTKITLTSDYDPFPYRPLLLGRVAATGPPYCALDPPVVGLETACGAHDLEACKRVCRPRGKFVVWKISKKARATLVRVQRRQPPLHATPCLNTHAIVRARLPPQTNNKNYWHSGHGAAGQASLGMTRKKKGGGNGFTPTLAFVVPPFANRQATQIAAVLLCINDWQSLHDART